MIDLIEKQQIKLKVNNGCSFKCSQQRKEKEWILLLKEGKKNGRWFKYYRNGNKQYDKNYKLDTLVGKYIEYFQNGNVDMEGSYNEKGLLIGTYKKYHQNGVDSIHSHPQIN